MKISVFVHDLAARSIVRPAPFALALRARYDVEVLGLLCSGPDVYSPYRHLFEYQTEHVPLNVGAVLPAISRLAARATGDVMYAFKPLVTSFGPALAAASARRAPLLLDAEDDEWMTTGQTWPAFVWKDLIKGWRHATSWKYTRALHPLVRRVTDGVSVSSRALQRRYGGVLVRHGPDEVHFDPQRPDCDRARARVRFGLPPDVPVALFAGVPQPHKGWPTLLAALDDARATDWHLALAGPAGHPDFVEAARRLGDRCHLMGFLPNGDMPALLAAIDAVPVPQIRSPLTESQLPAKVLEAMAMARPVIATKVGDLPEILGDNQRGWLVDPGDAGALAAALRHVADDAFEVNRRSRRARRWFLAEAGREAALARLEPLIHRALDSRRAHSA